MSVEYICKRCGNLEINSVIMNSWFDGNKICTSCLSEEMRHLLYYRAKEYAFTSMFSSEFIIPQTLRYGDPVDLVESSESNSEEMFCFIFGVREMLGFE